MLASENLSQATRAGLPAEYNSHLLLGLDHPGKVNRQESQLPVIGFNGPASCRDRKSTGNNP